MRKPGKDRAPIVIVDWLDSSSASYGWADRRKAIRDGVRFATEPMRAVGILIAEREDVIVLALMYNPHNDDAGHVLAIPRVAVKEIRLLKIGKRLK